jgi:hypothetical protein
MELVMVTHARNSGRPHPVRLLLAGLCVSCVGTPTPDPPDFDPLPRPSEDTFVREGAVRVLTTVTDGPLMLPLDAARGAVPGGSEVWIVNLDDPNASAQTVRARDDGSFSVMVTGRIDQRFRLLYRTSTNHSLPIDLQIAGNETSVALVPIARDAALDCLTVEPSEEITRAPNESERHVFRVENRCSETLSVDRAELRFGDRGFRLTTPPETIPANGSADLTVLFPAHDDDRERDDIVLLELGSSDLRLRYALGVWSRPRE